MKTKVLVLLTLASLTVKIAIANQLPAFMGDWVGRYIDPPNGTPGVRNPTLLARIIGKKDNTFEVQFLNAFERRAKLDFEKEIKAEDNSLRYADGQWEFKIKGNTLSGAQIVTLKNGRTVRAPFEMKKVERLSPTLGRPAPEDADILIGENLNQWQHKEGQPATWKLVSKDTMEIFPKKSGNEDGGSLYTKKSYGDCEIHLEFKLPYEPENSGAGRSNSGIFIQNNYEVQILDSYGVDSGWTDCGALYKVSPAKVNRCSPPEQWQTYDITFRAARYDSSGKLLEHPIITVLHNGRPIHKDEVIPEIPYNTEIRRLAPHPKEPLPIYLQDHGHSIQFRNMWVREL
ncbi:MAG: DUF1080 domain-containing protein [Verrucomicrobiota bacterium]